MRRANPLAVGSNALASLLPPKRAAMPSPPRQGGRGGGRAMQEGRGASPAWWGKMEGVAREGEWPRWRRGETR